MNWNAILAGTSAKPVTIVGWNGEPPVMDTDIALFSFPSGKKVELQWDDENEEYVVSLYGQLFERLKRERLDGVNDAMAKVRTFAEIASVNARINIESFAPSRTSRRPGTIVFEYAGQSQSRAQSIGTGRILALEEAIY